MEEEKFIKYWEQFEEETKHLRQIKTGEDVGRYFKGDFYDFMMWFRERIKNLPSNNIKNCECQNPKPNGKIEVGHFEGRYEICKNCGRRIWFNNFL